MKLSTLINISPSLQVLTAMKLPIKPSFRISTAIAAVNAVLTTFEKSRVSLLEQYGKMNEDGQSYTILPENATKFQEEFYALLEEEVEVALPKIKLTELGDLSIEPQHLVALSEMLVDE